MKTILRAWVVAMIVTSLSAAQTANQMEEGFRQHTLSPIPEDARYVIVQAPFAAKATFMLDRQEGTVWQLQQSADKSVGWKRLDVEKHRWDKKEEGKPCYALFISRLGIQFTYLINFSSGATWLLVESAKDGLWFKTMPND